ncbi:SufE family protein [Rhodoligotrophos defluvii]|uniref:SufE family protein n=1 Tax=Rhodoligotrophos defluvii TaxID=2561934 RepID=UPI0010C9AD71|nr:SufE family protein [Rhodoligotrophos defluvii]
MSEALAHTATAAAPQDAAIARLIEDFELLDDWEERYRYLIELGRDLPPLNEHLRVPENKVRGCASQVWLHTSIAPAEPGNPVLTFQGDSDAHIVKGLIAVLFMLYSGRTARSILAVDPQVVFSRLGLDEHLTPQRANGFSAMVGRIRADAQAALS